MLCVLIRNKIARRCFYSFFKLSSDGSEVELQHGGGWVKVEDFFTYQSKFCKREVHYVD